MNRETFEDYIARFNARDVSAFDMYLSEDMQMLNGALRFQGIDAMKHHYVDLIWPHFDEKLNLIRFVGDDQHVAVELRTEFTALHDAETIFGPVVQGEEFVYRGLIFYDLTSDGRFSSITVSYNSFTNIKRDGTTVDMGLPH